MKKITKNILIVISIICNIILFYNNYDLRKEVLSYKENTKINKRNMISMMLETETNSKTYIQSTDSAWPNDGYKFNEEMSGCEQGSKLSWDEENKKVIMEGNVSDKCYVFFDKEDPINLINYSITSKTNNIIVTLNITGGSNIKYYYSKDNGVTFIESSQNTYTFSNLSSGTYTVKAYAENNGGIKTETVSKTITITSENFASYIMAKYTGTQGNNNLYYHTSSYTYSAGDNSYRYAGTNPDNYVCFGTDTTPCPEDNLYRIVGVFNSNNHGLANQNLVKLMKLTSYGTYAWNSSGTKNWPSSSLKTILNSTFLTEKLNGYEDKIAEVTWYLGGASSSMLTAEKLYNEEIATAKTTTTGKVGLIYATDYAYATTNRYWTTEIIKYNEEACEYDWMYIENILQWTITQNSGSGASAIAITGTGLMGYASNLTYTYTVRPTFFLTSSVNVFGGTGTSTDPFIIG